MCTSIEEDLNICEILINLKSLVLHKKPIQVARRKKRNTLRRKRSNFESLGCWSYIKPRRVSDRLLASSYHKKQQSKQVAQRNYVKQCVKKGKKRQTSLKSYTRIDFDLENLFGATVAEEINRRSSVDDFSTQSRLSLVERQQGWIIETRKRGSRKDKHFRHERTNLRFRSMIQVKAFIRNRIPPKEQA